MSVPSVYLIAHSPLTGNPICYYLAHGTLKTVAGHRDVEEAVRRYGQFVATGIRKVGRTIEWVDRYGAMIHDAELEEKIRNARGIEYFDFEEATR